MMRYFNDEMLEECPRCGGKDLHHAEGKQYSPKQYLVKCTCRECLEQWKVWITTNWPLPSQRPDLEIVP